MVRATDTIGASVTSPRHLELSRATYLMASDDLYSTGDDGGHARALACRS